MLRLKAVRVNASNAAVMLIANTGKTYNNALDIPEGSGLTHMLCLWSVLDVLDGNYVNTLRVGLLHNQRGVLVPQ